MQPIKNGTLAFIDAYFTNGMNGTDAYVTVHPNCTRSAARSCAYDILTKPHVKAEIARRLAANHLEADVVLHVLADHAKATITPFVTINSDGFPSFDFSKPGAAERMHTIKRLKARRSRRVTGRGINAEEWEDEVVEVELHDAQGALEKLGRHLNLFDDKPVLNFNLNVDGLDKLLDKVYGDGKKSKGG